MTINVDRMRRYNQGGRAWRTLTAPYPVQDWFTPAPIAAEPTTPESSLRDQLVPEGAAPRYIPGVSP